MTSFLTSEPKFEVCPFSIVIDSNESAPWQFLGIKTRAKAGSKFPLVVRTIKKPMWNMGRDQWGTGLADYSIDGLEEEIQIERKSIDDLFGTLGQRRQNFKREISRLNDQCKVAYVIVEGSWGHIARYTDHGPDPSSVVGTIISWSQRFQKVHWVIAGTRDMAERLAFRCLERYWINREERAKTESKLNS
jgi:DNA-binding ferritin-like protein (Dps family)